MSKSVNFAVIGDCHYSEKGNYSTRDCLGAKRKVCSIVECTIFLLTDSDLSF